MTVSAQAPDGGDGMAAWIPLFQTGIWVLAIVIVLAVFRRQIKLLWEAIDKRLAEGAVVKMGPLEFGELKARVGAVENKVESLSDRVSKAFLAAMSDSMFGQLIKLNDGKFGDYIRHPGLDRELRHLRDIGYVEIESVRGIPECGDDLSKYVRITDKGRRYVELKKELEALD